MPQMLSDNLRQLRAVAEIAAINVYGTHATDVVRDVWFATNNSDQNCYMVELSTTIPEGHREVADFIKAHGWQGVYVIGPLVEVY